MTTFVELIKSEDDLSGFLRLTYGSRLDDPLLFVLTLLASYERQPVLSCLGNNHIAAVAHLRLL